MVLVFALACASAVVGFTLLVRGALGTTPSLTELADDLRRPRSPSAATVSVVDRIVTRLAGSPTAERSADLAVCDRTEEWFVQQRFVWAVLAAAPGLALFAISSCGAGLILPAPCRLAASGAVLAFRWLYSRIDLRSAAPVRSEVQALALGRPGRLCVDGRIIGDARQALGGQVEHEDVEVAGAARQGQCEPASIWREGGRPVHACAGGNLAPFARAHALHEHGSNPVLERHIGQPLAVRRPGR